MGGSFYKGAECCLLIFDITRAATFDALSNWKKEFLQHASIRNPEEFPFILIGNKVDREEDRKVPESKARKWCKDNGDIPYFETSAKDNKNVKEAFEMAGRKGLHNQKTNM